MAHETAKKYYIKTLGCQANEADSSMMAGILEVLDFEPIYAQLPKGAGDENDPTETELLKKILSVVDLFIVNTCSVRQKSEDKVFGLGKVFKELAEQGVKKPYVVMSGCMVGSVTGERKRYEFDDLKKKTPWVDLYINPSQIYELPDFLYKNNVLSDWALQKYKSAEIVPKHEGGSHAYINISYGCDNFCTFCVVPYSRGKEVSRTREEILREIKHLIVRGVDEFTLCGQNVNSWGLSVSEKFKIRSGSNQKLPFADLLREVAALPEVKKITFISSNPFDFTDDLVEVIKCPKISNYLHIAVQSGSNEVLRNMHRRHTIEEFYALITKLRSVRPDVEIGTDIIVGFPGETRDQFMQTVKLFEDIKFNVAFISMYSVRKGTTADKSMPDDVPAEEKKWRSAYLTDVWKKTKPVRAK